MEKSAAVRLNKFIYERYVRLSENLHNSWIQFKIQDEIHEVLALRCQDEGYGRAVRADFESPINPERRPRSRLRGRSVADAVVRFSLRELPEALFLGAVALFEAFVSDVARAAYTADPDTYLRPRGSRAAGGGPEKEKMDEKILTMLLDSSDRQEAIERVVEERLRGIFYGDPLDVLKENKLGFNIHEKIQKICELELDRYKEMVARRNVLVHNAGRVDRKYVRETVDPSLELGEKVRIDEEYLRRALETLNIIAKYFAWLVALRATKTKLKRSRLGELRLDTE